MQSSGGTADHADRRRSTGPPTPQPQRYNDTKAATSHKVARAEPEMRHRIVPAERQAVESPVAGENPSALESELSSLAGLRPAEVPSARRFCSYLPDLQFFTGWVGLVSWRYLSGWDAVYSLCVCVSLWWFMRSGIRTRAESRAPGHASREISLCPGRPCRDRRLGRRGRRRFAIRLLSTAGRRTRRRR